MDPIVFGSFILLLSYFFLTSEFLFYFKKSKSSSPSLGIFIITELVIFFEAYYANSKPTMFSLND